MTPSTVYSPSGQALSEKFLTRFRAVATPQPRLRKAQPWKLSPSNAARRPDIANAATGRHPFHRESLYLHPRWQRASVQGATRSNSVPPGAASGVVIRGEIGQATNINARVLP